MSKFVIKGKSSLKGVVRLGGAKNASFKLMIASLLCKGENRLLNFSRIGSVAITRNIIQALGGKVRSHGERTLFINATELNKFELPVELSDKTRATTMFAGPLLARFGKAVLPIPGGDKLGSRPLQRHFNGLKQMNVEVNFANGAYILQTDKLIGTEYCFPKNTHTGTETLVMAAVCAKGKTTLKNTAEEPEVDDLIEFLNKMGAKINRQNRTITIQGLALDNLHPTIHSVVPDRNEAVTYACAALGTQGDVIVENAIPKHLQAFLTKVEQAGGNYEIGDYGIRFYADKQLKATDIVTQPHPGFMTDWQPLWGTLMTQAKGTSEIVEAIFPSRFGYAEQLIKMGAKIDFYNPDVKNPKSFYNFDLEDDKKEFKHGIRIIGPRQLKGIKTRVANLRAGATLTLAAMMAEGETILTNIAQIDRGYENLDRRLLRLGANIKRV